MKHPDLPILEDAIHAVLSPHGFKKQKLVWRRTLPELIQVVGLDKSRWGPKYNLVYGISLTRFSDNPSPSLQQVQVEWPWTAMLGKRVRDMPEKRGLLDALDLAKPIDKDDRTARTQRLIHELVLPAFEATTTVDDLRMVLNDYKHPVNTTQTRFLPKEL